MTSWYDSPSSTLVTEPPVTNVDSPPVTTVDAPPRCECDACRYYGETTCDGTCADCTRSNCAQCRRNYPRSENGCEECDGNGCCDCGTHDTMSCCGVCGECDEHPDGASGYDVCDRGHCHSCDHACD